MTLIRCTIFLEVKFTFDGYEPGQMAEHLRGKMQFCAAFPPQCASVDNATSKPDKKIAKQFDKLLFDVL